MTPAKVGPVRIVDAVNQVLTLVAGDGSVFTFDVVSRQWIEPSATGVYQRKAGAGTIVESPTTPYATPDDKIGNQWNEMVGEQLVTVLAGTEAANPWQGIVVVVVADAKGS